MMPNYLLLLPILIPTVGALLTFLTRADKNAGRNVLVTLFTLLTSASAWLLVLLPPSGEFTFLAFTDAISFTLRLDGAGRIFMGLSSALWPLALFYSFDYMKHHGGLRSFYAFFTAAFAATMGIAMSGNIMTMYLFYELLTLSTLPLFMSDKRKSSYAAARKYMMYSFGGAALAFTTIAFLIYVGANDFVLGGALGGYTGDTLLASVMLLFAFFGFGVKAAIFPLHDWLPSATVAPTPVTALLHAVAVVKAGAFAVIRLLYYSFGTSFLRETRLQSVVMAVAIFTLLFGSCMALKQIHLKKRFAYSTVSNLSYILFAASLLTDDGLVAAFLHMVFHSVMKMTIFLAAGAVLHYTEREMIEDLSGLGRKMPVTFVCFTASGLALAGIPPLSGFISKWSIANAAIAEGSTLAFIGAAVLIVAALLVAVYALSVAVRAFFPPRDADLSGIEGACEASPLMTIPMLLLTLGSILGGVLGGYVIELFTAILLG